MTSCAANDGQRNLFGLFWGEFKDFFVIYYSLGRIIYLLYFIYYIIIVCDEVSFFFFSFLFSLFSKLKTVIHTNKSYRHQKSIIKNRITQKTKT